MVIDPTFDWGDDAPPDIPFHKSVFYEVHVKGATARHPEIPPELRGRYAGLASDPMIRYLTELGITAVELLPVHGFVDDKHLLDQGKRNYWGYNSIAFFAPDVRYRSVDIAGAGVVEFKHMVKRLHAAGIEVILDVVYNHTPPRAITTAQPSASRASTTRRTTASSTTTSATTSITPGPAIRSTSATRRRCS